MVQKRNSILRHDRLNDMPQVVHHVLKLFADDSKLIRVIRNQNDLTTMQSDLDALTQWAKDWRMVFHPDKCKLMVINKLKHVSQNHHGKQRFHTALKQRFHTAL